MDQSRKVSCDSSPYEGGTPDLSCDLFLQDTGAQAGTLASRLPDASLVLRLSSYSLPQAGPQCPPEPRPGY